MWRNSCTEVGVSVALSRFLARGDFVFFLRHPCTRALPKHFLPWPLTHMSIFSPYRTGSRRNTVFMDTAQCTRWGRARAMGQVAQGKVAHEHRAGTAATRIVAQSSHSRRTVVHASALRRPKSPLLWPSARSTAQRRSTARRPRPPLLRTGGRHRNPSPAASPARLRVPTATPLRMSASNKARTVASLLYL